VSTAKQLSAAARTLSDAVDRLSFAEPITHVYNPLRYAWKPHSEYIRRFGEGRKKVVMLGMNPGPYGMAQTGVPFGEIAAARDWMGIEAKVSKPDPEHPKRPVDGFGCSRSEVSGRRLWGFFSERFDSADAFFKEHYVANYCPLVFMQESGKNHTPDKLPAAEKMPLDAACDVHLKSLLEILNPEWAVGVGAFAEAKLQAVASSLAKPPKVTRILHPSPASPAANRGWGEAALKQLEAAGVW
jgi:single-strand selective monofunctional uracil DNA glycosylase